MALSGYETASPEDILKPGTEQVASLKTLLRRVRSEQYLLPPEKLSASEALVKQALELQEARNQFTHLVPGHRPPDFARLPQLCRSVLSLMEHLLVTSPSFSDPDLSKSAARRLKAIGEALPKAVD